LWRFLWVGDSSSPLNTLRGDITGAETEVTNKLQEIQALTLSNIQDISSRIDIVLSKDEKFILDSLQTILTKKNKEVEKQKEQEENIKRVVDVLKKIKKWQNEKASRIYINLPN